MESMTGYGESRFSLEGVKFQFRIRSLNSKYADTEFYFPKELSWLEPKAENLVKKKFTRGKVQVYLDTDRSLPRTAALNNQAMGHYRQLFQDFYGKKKVEIPMEALVQIPGIFDMRGKNWPEYESRFEFYFMRAVVKAERMRKREGNKIRQTMRPIIRLLMRYTQKVRILQERLQTRAAKSIRQRYVSLQQGSETRSKKSLPQLSSPIGRKMWNEIKDEIIGMFHVDISEEVDRLNIHLPEIQAILDVREHPDPIGRKLEFYFQEILREVNTLTSKTRDAQINQMGIQMKFEIEKLREQVRNIA